MMSRLKPEKLAGALSAWDARSSGRREANGHDPNGAMSNRRDRNLIEFGRESS